MPEATRLEEATMPRPITPRAQISGRGLTGPCGSISRPRTLSDSDSRVTLTLDVARGTGTAHRACTLVGSGPRLILFAVRRLAIGLLAVGLPAVSFLLGARVLFMQKVALVTIQPRQDMRLRETGVLSFSLPKLREEWPVLIGRSRASGLFSNLS